MHNCLENNSINFKEGGGLQGSAGVVLEAVRLRVSQLSQSDVHYWKQIQGKSLHEVSETKYLK